MAEEEEPSNPAFRAARFMGQGLAIGVAILFPALLAGLIYLLVPAEAPSFDDPSTLEAVFDSRFAITVARILMLFATVYVVVSVVALISQGQWLSSVGPFKVADSVKALEETNKDLSDALQDAVATAGALDDLLLDSQREVLEVQAELEAALAQLELRSRAELPPEPA